MLVHGIAEIDECFVRVAEPQKTLLRELNLERGVDGEGDGYCLYGEPGDQTQ